jgi:hypothetical protein
MLLNDVGEISEEKFICECFASGLSLDESYYVHVFDSFNGSYERLADDSCNTSGKETFEIFPFVLMLWQLPVYHPQQKLSFINFLIFKQLFRLI